MPANVKVLEKLDDQAIRFIADGGCVVLTDNYPAVANMENFRTHTSGRSIGHSGALMNPHPIWDKFPHAGHLDWQFYPMMFESHSMTYSKDMPEFAPIFRLIPSFKMVKHKSMLSEFAVGKGRLIISGFRFDADDPAAKYMFRLICEYLGSGDFASAPVWEPEALTKANASAGIIGRCGKKVDAGGRPFT
jgi:hypothetical protein